MQQRNKKKIGSKSNRWKKKTEKQNFSNTGREIEIIFQQIDGKEKRQHIHRRKNGSS